MLEVLGKGHLYKLIIRTHTMYMPTTLLMVIGIGTALTTKENILTFQVKYSEMVGARATVLQDLGALTMILLMPKRAPTILVNSVEVETKWEWAIIAWEGTLFMWVITSSRSKAENSTISQWVDVKRNSMGALLILCRRVSIKLNNRHLILARVITTCNKNNLRPTL